MNKPEDLSALAPGEVLCFGDDGSALSAAIAAAQKDGDQGLTVNGYPACQVTHCGVKGYGDDLYEMLGGGLARSNIEGYAARPLAAFRFLALTPRQADAMVTSLNFLLAKGVPYGYAELAFDLFDCVTHTKFLTDFFGQSDLQCSQLPAFEYFRIVTGRDDVFGESWKSVRPDVVFAWAASHPETWGCDLNSLPKA
jgi:hypothetical protein